MAIALAILGVVCGWLLVQHIRSILELRSLYRQLQELEQGSHMELGVQSRQRDMLVLCRQINRLQKVHHQEQIQYERAEKQLKQNITGLAHDIRTPLTGAAGYVQLARECEEPRRREYYLQVASDRLGELGDMLEELFLYTRLTSEEFVPDMQDVQVLPLLSDCLVGLYHRFEEKGVSPQVDFAQEGFRVRADEECLQRIFHNLIQNALLHGSGGIVIRQEQDSLIFENKVSETSRPDPEHIFDRFYKADSARRKGSSGLGLFIVKELTERMGGSVQALLEGDRLRIILMLETSVGGELAESIGRSVL
ncbi:MAG: HAMP domain-containing histidine kinase [Acetatifactor sp.]|nr:HAMP domain-containing histidine kinase [Acetatifactor sp.]